MIILGIETSCDETAAAIILGKENKITTLSSIVSSQIEIHKKYGGVVPELAAREHILNIIPVIKEAIEDAKITRGEITAIAVTTGPGLVTSLISGVETAKTLSYAWQIPLISINHIEGHIYSSFIEADPDFPSIILTVSGGHTILALMEGHGKIKKLGETRDDAAGEAFDKAAKLMNIGYPGGPNISRLATDWQGEKKINLPRPMIHSSDFDFSFSGLKTAIRYELEKDANWQSRQREYCHEFQQAIIDVLIHKTIKAAQKCQARTVILSGGVSANIELRHQLREKVETELINTKFICPNLLYTTDNAAMIAAAGYFKAQRKEFTDWKDIKVDCTMELE